MSVTARKFQIRQAARTSGVGLAGIALGVLCSGCFLTDEFRIRAQLDDDGQGGNAPEATHTGVSVPPSAETTDTASVPSEMPSAVPTDTNVEPPPSAPSATATDGANPPDSTAPDVTAPAPSDSAPSGADAAPGPPLDAGTLEELLDASAPTTSSSTSNVAPLDAAATNEPAPDSGRWASCEMGWSYDAALELCVSDCKPDEVRGPNGRCYWFGSQPVNFNRARTLCSMRAMGWSMISVKSLEEHEFFEAQLVADTWLGASDSQTPNTWRWLDDNTAFWQGNEFGAAVNNAFTRWGGEEPSAANDEACARYHTSSTAWTWSDCACEDPYRAACAGPAPVEPEFEWGGGGGRDDQGGTWTQ